MVMVVIARRASPTFANSTNRRSNHTHHLATHFYAILQVIGCRRLHSRKPHTVRPQGPRLGHHPETSTSRPDFFVSNYDFTSNADLYHDHNVDRNLNRNYDFHGNCQVTSVLAATFP